MSLTSSLASLVLALPPRQSRRIRVDRAVPVPMRDGVTLVGDRYVPEGNDRPPLVLMRSPYGRGMIFGLMARLFAERGFQVFLQSCRGTGGSGGVFSPMRQERADGVDTVRWLGDQPWFGGRLYTFGLSYLGYVQWAIAAEAGHLIDAMGLQVTLSNFRNETLAFGGFTQEGSLEWSRIIDSLQNRRPLKDRLLRRAPRVNMKQIHQHLPLNELDRLATGRTLPWWQEWLAHDQPDDPWWAQVDQSEATRSVAVPAVMVGGWRDIFLPWQIRDFEAMQARGRDVWLTIGPWGHASLAGMAEGFRQSHALFAAHSRGEQPLPERDRVMLYVMGADTWRGYPSWPPPDSRQASLYLTDGRLAMTPAETAGSSRWRYDPSDPTPSVHGPKVMGGARKPDMSRLERRRDVVTFSSPPLTADCDLIGPVAGELYLRSSLEHTDVYVCLCDVDTRGRALHVLDGYMRLRPGDAPPDHDGVRTVRVDCWPTAYRFRRGHRIKLLVASGAHPRYARNTGTGEPLGSVTRLVASDQELFHDAVRPSRLIVTVSGSRNELPLA